MSFNMNNGGTWGWDLRKITGALVVTNNASISLGTNNSMSNCLGTGPFAACSDPCPTAESLTTMVTAGALTIIVR